jgi:hypothetical protein
MLEHRINYELYLYKRVDTPNFKDTKEVKWSFVRRMASRSTDLFEFSHFHYLYSPNLMLFFDSNDTGDQFSIRHTFDQSIVVNIPTGILNSKINNPKNVVKHLLWLSNTRFKIINNDSIEKIFEITPDNKLKSVAQGAVPMLKIDETLVKEKYHFYKDRMQEDYTKNYLQYTLIRKV